jgi:hypothetical protein
MHRSTLSILIVAGSLSLFGWGCKKAADTNTPTSTGYVSNAYLPPEPAPETQNQINVRELREAIAQFQTARTFRSKLQVKTSDGNVTGQIDVMKPGRFHGTVQAPDASGKSETSEIVAVDDMFYIRLANGEWAFVKTKEKARALTEAFRSTVDGQDSVLMTLIPDSAIVKKSIDSGLKCDRYETDVTDANGENFNLKVCVSSGLPKRIEVVSASGNATIDYFDYNRLITIERPIGLQP